jgi:serine/threonine protein kinase
MMAAQPPQAQEKLTLAQRDQVIQLCSEFKKSDTAWSTLIIVAKPLLETAEGVVPAPFNLLVQAALGAVNMALSARANKSECDRLAGRVSRVSFLVLELTLKENWSETVLQCIRDLKIEFDRAVKLLEEFRGGTDVGVFERAKIARTKLSVSTAKEFADIHTALTTLVSETTLGVSLAIYDRAPSLHEIRVAMRDEVAAVIEEIQWEKQEMQSVLDSPIFKGLPVPMFTLGDVTIDRSTVLGGAVSNVYAGTLYGQTEVAVKVVALVHQDALKSVEAEVRRANLSRHRNVVHVYGTVESPTGSATVGVVMERLGVSLEKTLAEGAIEKRRRMKYTLDIIAGMEHMHNPDHRVMHFDLTPAHILLTQDKRSAKIIDFGSALTADTLAEDANAATESTMRVMAPELLDEDMHPSSACDVYSFAVVLAELWTGTEAWKETPKHLIPTAVKAGQRPFSFNTLSAMGVPHPIIALIAACWAQNLHHRPKFSDLGQLRGIPCFEDSPREAWPSFLRNAAATTELEEFRALQAL